MIVHVRDADKDGKKEKTVKTFNSPRVAMIIIPGDDIIASSLGCERNTCYGYQCNDCSVCNGSYSCDIYLCSSYAN